MHCQHDLYKTTDKQQNFLHTRDSKSLVSNINPLKWTEDNTDLHLVTFL